MYSRNKFNENTSLNVSYIFFQNLMGLVKFSVRFLVGPSNCTSTHQGDAPNVKYAFLEHA